MRITAEWNKLRKVAVHRPGFEMFLGLLNPKASLYERAFNQTLAEQEHDSLRNALRDQFGVKVIGLREQLSALSEKSPKQKRRLALAAMDSIDFKGSEADAVRAKNELLKDMDSFDSNYFINIIMLKPSMSVRRGAGIDSVHINITERDPMSDLYFMRDQQAVTDRGIFMSRMSKPQRTSETVLTRLLWEMMDMKIIGGIAAPGTFEGGDFMPLGDFALIGTGERTNSSGAMQLLTHGQSFPEVSIVHQPQNPIFPHAGDPMSDMHLDTYFNVAGKGVAVGSESLLRLATVETYFREGDSYVRSKGSTNLHDYVRSKGFEIIELSALEQLSYASNFLCISDRKILAVETRSTIGKTILNLERKAASDKSKYANALHIAKKEYAKLISSGSAFPHKKELRENGIEAYSINLSSITGGYGGAHCMTAPLLRG